MPRPDARIASSLLVAAMAAMAGGACGLSTIGELGGGPEGGADGAPDGWATNLDAGDAPPPSDARPENDGHDDGQGGPGDALADGTAESGGDAGCPGTSGPPMISVGAFCIDSTEVTQAHYAEFIAADAGTGRQPSFCSWNNSYTPTGQWPSTATTINNPVTSVNWCDAYAYCAWAGKRMCGQIGGGPVAPNAGSDAGASQWVHACSHDGTLVYPYGNTYGMTTCNGIDANAGMQIVSAVGTFPNCVGGYPAIYDMSGNVREWEDSCSGMAGQNDMCNERGGSVNFGAANLACAAQNLAPRTDSNVHLGIRCCAP
jgi:sulfatase modifying factor 1